MKVEIIGNPEKLGRRKKVALYVKQCPELSDRGYNMAIEVYELEWKTGLLKMIGADYAIQTASWKGERGNGINIIAEKYPDLKHSAYLISDNRVLCYQPI